MKENIDIYHQYLLNFMTEDYPFIYGEENPTDLESIFSIFSEL